MVTPESLSNPCLGLIIVKKNCVSYLEKTLPRGSVSYKKERETRQMLEEGRYRKTGREIEEKQFIASPYHLTFDEKNFFHSGLDNSLMSEDLEALSLTSVGGKFPSTSFDQLQKHGSAQCGKIGNEKLLFFSSVHFLITLKQTSNV